MRRLRFTLTCAILMGVLSLACRPASGPPWQQSAPTPEPAELALVSPGSDTGEDPHIQGFTDQ